MRPLRLRKRSRHSLNPYLSAPANRVTLLVDGENTFPAMLEAIRQAGSSILMGSYIFHDDRVGRSIADALIERAQSGVPVYLIVDGFGTGTEPPSFCERLERDGLNLLVYRPPAPWRRGWGRGPT